MEQGLFSSLIYGVMCTVSSGCFTRGELAKCLLICEWRVAEAGRGGLVRVQEHELKSPQRVAKKIRRYHKT